MISNTIITPTQLQEATQKVYISRNLYRKSSRALMRNMAVECLSTCNALTANDTQEAEALAKALIKLFRQKELLCLTLPQNLCYEKTNHPAENFSFPQDFYTALTNDIGGEVLYNPENRQTHLNKAYQSASEAHLKPMLTNVIKNNLLHYLVYQCTQLMDSIAKPENITFKNDPIFIIHKMADHPDYQTFLPNFIDIILHAYQNNKNSKTEAIFNKILTLIEILFSNTARTSLSNLVNNHQETEEAHHQQQEISTLRELVSEDSLKQLTTEQLFRNINKHRDKLTTKRVATGFIFKTKPSPNKDQKLFEHIDRLVEQYNDILEIPLPDVNLMRDTPERVRVQNRSQLSEAEANELAEEAFISPALYNAGSMLSNSRSARDIRTMTAQCLFQIEQQRRYSLSDDHRRALALEITKLIKETEISDLYLGQTCYNNVTSRESREKNFSFPQTFFICFADQYLQSYSSSTAQMTLPVLAYNVTNAYQEAVDQVLRPFFKNLVQNNLVRYLRYLAIELIKKATPSDNRLGRAFTNSKLHKLIEKGNAKHKQTSITTTLLNQKKTEMENHTDYASFISTFVDFIDSINQLNTTAISGATAPEDQSLIKIHRKISKIIELINANNMEATKAGVQEHQEANGYGYRYSSVASLDQHGNGYYDDHNQRKSMIDLSVENREGTAESTRDIVTKKRSAYANIPGIQKLTSSEGEELYSFLDRLLDQFDDLTQAPESLLSNATHSTMHTTTNTPTTNGRNSSSNKLEQSKDTNTATSFTV